MDEQSKSKPPSAKVFWLVWLTTLALAAGSFALVFRFGPFTDKATVFRQTAHGWEALPPLGSLGYDIRISGRGVVWVLTDKGLSRLDGASWHRFTAADFGTGHGYLTEFALDGEEVWGAAPDGVVHFDGKRWQRSANAIAAGQATSIAAANGQVWTIDREGNLSHFDGAVWTVRRLDLPGVIWNVSTTRYPKLALTGDGTLWLAFLGLWRSDGASWTRISSASRKAELLGVEDPGAYVRDGKKVVTRGSVWVRDGGEVVGFGEDGVASVRHSLHHLGLLDSTRVYGVAGRAPLFAFTSSQGLTWFDGSKWHPEQLKSLGLVTATRIGLSPDGSLWGIGYPTTALKSIPFRRVALASLILSLFAIGYPIWWRARRQQQATRGAALHATGALPEDIEASSGWKTAGGVVVGLVLVGGSFWLAHHWRTAIKWLLVVFILIAILEYLWKSKTKPSDPIGPGDPPRYDWVKSLPAILGCLAVLWLLYGVRIASYLHLWWLAAFPESALLLGGVFLCSAYDWFRGYRVEREIKRCRYGRALEMLDGPLGRPSTEPSKLLRADALFLSGRSPEAEPILRRLVETKNAARHKALAFEHLGRVLMAQNCYEDAKRAFEAAALLMPKRPAAYSGLAELRLLQGLEPALALEDAEHALQLHRHSLLERRGSKRRLAIIRGNQAWALARLGRSAESQQAIEDGVREMDLHYIPEVAGFYWRAGMAMLAIENATAAAGHFRRAAELDPQGHYGRLATENLSQHCVGGAVEIAGRRG